MFFATGRRHLHRNDPGSAQASPGPHRPADSQRQCTIKPWLVDQAASAESESLEAFVKLAGGSTPGKNTLVKVPGTL